MRWADRLGFVWGALQRQPFRSSMLLLAVAVGVAAVVVLTGIGEGARSYVQQQFLAIGQDTLVILPGRKETTGGMPPLTGNTTRDLTIADSQAVGRLPGVERVAPIIAGSAEVGFGGISREAVILGTTRPYFAIRQLQISQGRRLPAIEADKARPVCIIGQRIREEIFPAARPLGQWMRIGDRRCRVIGLLASQGGMFGIDMSEVVIIPVASAETLFNVPGLFRVLLQYQPRLNPDRLSDRILDLMTQRHQGEADVTVVAPDSILTTFDDLLLALTLAVSGISGISLLVAGILIMNMMLITVNQRSAEIGLLKAIGASAGEVRTLFLLEAALIALLGAGVGSLLGESLLLLGRTLFPTVPLVAPPWALLAACGVAIATGTGSALLPATRAARLDPVRALGAR